MSTPNHPHLAVLAMGLSSARFEAHFNPLGDHLRFYTPGSLERLLDDFGFEAIAIEKAVGPRAARRLLLASARRTRW